MYGLMAYNFIMHGMIYNHKQYNRTCPKKKNILII